MKIGQNRAPDLKIRENFISRVTPARFYRPQGPRIDFFLISFIFWPRALSGEGPSRPEALGPREIKFSPIFRSGARF